MEWRPEYSVGDDAFDADHKIIFDLIGVFRDTAKDEDIVSLLDIAFNKLMDYMDEHFAREEQFMREINYPAINAHHAQHGEMETQLRSLYERHNAGDTAVAADMIAFLDSWWHRHILEEDMAYARFAQAGGR